MRRELNRVLAVAIADAVLLGVLLYVAFVDHSDAAVSVIGPVHGIGFLVLLWLTARGAAARCWGWWFPALVLITGGPAGSIVGDLAIRRHLGAKTE